MNWNSIFNYRCGELYWKIKPSKCVKRGALAGRTNLGYRVCKYQGKNYRVHRIIWEIHNGPIPDGLQIDHIDGQKSNNILKNLRLVTARENQRNTPRKRNNTSGVTGVDWSNSQSKWRASIWVDGNRYHLGCFTSKQEAARARKNEEIRLGFHPNHGRIKNTKLCPK